MTPAGRQYLRDVEAKKLRHLRRIARALGVTIYDLGYPREPLDERVPEKPTTPRGFALLSKAEHRRISIRGGQAAIHRHRFTSDEARAAWKKRDR